MIDLNIKNDITDLIKELKNVIKNTIFENHVFIVGGTVRDLLLNRANDIKDIDIAVNVANGGIALAEFITKEYDCNKINSNPCIFPKYGTAKFNITTIHNFAKFNIECVETKKEHLHDGISHFGTLEEDARKRDLTINSIYYNISTEELIDPTHKGLMDIQQQIIRTPIDSNIIFKEDPLRMIRVIRFSSKYNWGIEKNTWFGIVKNADLISEISHERITEEINKILLTSKPSVGLNKLKGCGLLNKIMPSVFRLINVTQGKEHFGDVFSHTLKAVDLSSNNKINRWAALFHDIGKPNVKTNYNGIIHFYNHEQEGTKIALNVLKKLKFSNEDIKKIILVIKNHMRFKSYGDKCPSDKSIRKFIQDVGEENINLVLDIINADNLSHHEKYCMPKQVGLIKNRIDFLKEKEKELAIKSPVNGKDIMQRFSLKPSPAIGEYLQIINEFLINKPDADKEECLSYLENFLVC